MTKVNEESDRNRDDIILKPNVFDVLCGERGRGFDDRSGNRHYQALIESNVDRYCVAVSNDEKRVIVLNIVVEIQRNGRFMKVTEGCWTVLSQGDVRLKVSKSLQDRSRKKKLDDQTPTRHPSDVANADLSVRDMVILEVPINTLDPSDEFHRDLHVSSNPSESSHNLVRAVSPSDQMSSLTTTLPVGISSYQYWRTIAPSGLPEGHYRCVSDLHESTGSEETLAKNGDNLDRLLEDEAVFTPEMWKFMYDNIYTTDTETPVLPESDF